MFKCMLAFLLMVVTPISDVAVQSSGSFDKKADEAVIDVIAATPRCCDPGPPPTCPPKCKEPPS